MTSVPGSNIGPYEITREIGRGGMGVVYLARDGRLDRDVAIKALPEELAANPGRLERFEREAKTLASLNHPNIAAIYGVEEQQGQKYLVLEYVEGETLADRLDRGPLPPDEAVEVAVEIARGLEAAHEAGVIHRDLKPANIKLTPEGKVKVLDFGLAKADEGFSSTGSGLSQSPTMTSPLPQHSPTIPGAILGTAAYMSPEQARGRRVDKRTDIWSFGIVLYEMLAGASPFQGETASDSIGAVLHKDVEILRLPAGTPVAVHRVLKRCLQRDKELRYRDIGDARLELASDSIDEGGVGAAQPRAPVTAVLGITAVVLGLVGGAILGRQLLAPAPPEPTPMHVAVPVDNLYVPDGPSGTSFDIDPGATRLAYLATDPDDPSDEPAVAIYLRDIDKPDAVRLAGTEHARSLSFDPTGRWIAFGWEAQDGSPWELRRIAVDGRAPQTIIQDPRRYILSDPPTWIGPDRIALIGDDSYSVHLVDVASGTSRQLLTLGEAVPDALFIAQVSSNNDGALLSMTVYMQQGPDQPSWAIYEIDQETGQTRRITAGGFLKIVDNRYAVFFKDNAVLAAEWDPATSSLASPPIAVMGDQGNDAVARVSAGGTLAFTASNAGRTLGRIMSITRDGGIKPVSDLRRRFGGHITVSPEGNRLAVMVMGDPDPEVHVLDLRTGYLQRAIDFPVTVAPTWTADGRLVANHIRTMLDQRFYIRDLDRGGEPEPLFGADDPNEFTMATTFSPDGSLALVNLPNHTRRECDIYAVDMQTMQRHPLVVSELDNRSASLSPDGALLAYLSGPGDQVRVMVASFDRETMTVGPPTPVSAEGCRAPIWSPDGTELFWQDRNTDNFMAASITRPEGSSEFSAGTPEVLFTREQAEFEVDWSDYPIAVAPDGETFYYAERLGSSEAPRHVNLILNWDQELDRLLATD